MSPTTPASEPPTEADPDGAPEPDAAAGADDASATDASDVDGDDHPVAFGKYRIHRRIARGGMGEVFEARLVGELGFEKRLVIKTILPELASKRRFVEMFAAEAKTAVALNHGNIVPIYELGRADDTFYIVMGYVDGPSVDRMLERYREREEPPPLSVALHIVREVLVGLAYAHTDEPGRPAVVHRDVTPRNILVDRSGQVRIVDFGIAMPANVGVAVRGGSTGYMAPEQARAEQADPRADVFSTACLLYELVTLRRAFPKEGVWAMPDMDGVPEDLAEVLTDAMALDPTARPRDAGAMLGALAPFVARHASVVAGADLAAHLRELFVEGWEVPPTASMVASITPVTRLQPQTYATRLTSVSEPPLEAEADDDAAAMTSSGTSAGSVPAGRRLLPAAGLVLAGAGAAWLLLRAQSNPDPVVEPTPVAAVDTGRDAEAAPPAEGSGPGADPETEADAKALAGTNGPATTDAPPVATPVVVPLSVRPRDATVEVDGVALAGGSPFSIEVAPGATVDVVVRKDGFVEDRRTISADATDPLTIELAREAPKGKGYLQVFATGVAWAEVTVDGQKRGSTPTRKLELVEGAHKVVVRCVPDVCPQPQVLLSRSVTIRAGETEKVTAR